MENTDTLHLKFEACQKEPSISPLKKWDAAFAALDTEQCLRFDVSSIPSSREQDNFRQRIIQAARLRRVKVITRIENGFVYVWKR